MKKFAKAEMLKSYKIDMNLQTILVVLLLCAYMFLSIMAFNSLWSVPMVALGFCVLYALLQSLETTVRSSTHMWAILWASIITGLNLLFMITFVIKTVLSA